MAWMWYGLLIFGVATGIRYSWQFVFTVPGIALVILYGMFPETTAHIIGWFLAFALLAWVFGIPVGIMACIYGLICLCAWTYQHGYLAIFNRASH